MLKIVVSLVQAKKLAYDSVWGTKHTCLHTKFLIKAESLITACLDNEIAWREIG